MSIQTARTRSEKPLEDPLLRTVKVTFHGTGVWVTKPNQCVSAPLLPATGSCRSIPFHHPSPVPRPQLDQQGGPCIKIEVRVVF